MILSLRIENSVAGEACIDISSALFASGSLSIATIPTVGDMADVNGTPLTAIANGTVPAPGEFELGTTEAETATNLADAINDPVNGLNTLVIATATGSVVTIRALDDGVAGNAITLSSTVPLVIVASGATLTGGAAGSAGSTVGDNLIQILGCDLVQGAGAGFQLRASAVNNIYVDGGNWSEGATGTTFDVRDCAACTLSNVVCENVVLDYDNTNPNLPFIGTSTYEMSNVLAGAALTAGYVGAGSLLMTDCTIGGTTVYSGDSTLRSLVARRSNFGAMSVGGTGAVTLSNCARGTLTGGGTGTLAETTVLGSASFVATPVLTVPFAEPQPNLAYSVFIEMEGPPAAITDIPAVPSAAKTTTSFDIAFGAPQTLTLNYMVKRDI
jgi:hypothetical protein